MARTGDEPSHARSALGLRLALTVVGGIAWLVGAVIMVFAGQLLFAGLFGAVAVLSVVNAAVVVHRMRQGPHWQPGPTTPPYQPVAPERPPPRPPRPPVDENTRARRYLWIMGTCLALIILAWGFVRLWSVTAAVVMTLVAMVLPPIAAIVANAGWDRGQR